jgi:Zn-dependent alcohol dehydrogenase
MKTRAAIALAPKQAFSFVDVDLPALGPRDVLVRIAGVGICRTDLASRDGNPGAPFPAIFGHEGSEVVSAVGRDVTRSKSATTSCSRPTPAARARCARRVRRCTATISRISTCRPIRMDSPRAWRTAAMRTSSTSASRRSRTSRWRANAMP